MNIYHLKNSIILFLSALSVLLVITSPSVAAPTPNCPAPVPTSELSSLEGESGIKGYTVIKGDDIEEFDVEVVGVLNSAPIPGAKLVIGVASGAPIDASGGAPAAGMSGSPIYTNDGRLIGALSYGFSGASPIIGITPASLMMQTRANSFAEPIKTDKISSRFALPNSVKSKSVPSGFMKPLNMPMFTDLNLSTRSGVNLKQFISKQGGTLISNGTLQSDPATISRSSMFKQSPGILLPGGTVFEELSRGHSGSFGALGTVTYTCNNEFAAFGHPFMENSKIKGIASKGEIFGIVVDNSISEGPFKFGQSTEAVGTVSYDNIMGIGGKTGALPPVINIYGTIKGLTVNSYTGNITSVVKPEEGSVVNVFYLPSILTGASISNEIYSINYKSMGEAYNVSGGYIIKGRSNKGPFSFNYQDTFDGVYPKEGIPKYYSYDTGVSVTENLNSILKYASKNPSEKITVDSIRVNLKSNPHSGAFQVNGFQWKKQRDRLWKKSDKIPNLTKGNVIALKILFKKTSDDKKFSRIFRFKSISNGGSIVAKYSNPSGDYMPPVNNTASLKELLKSLSFRRSNQLFIKLKGFKKLSGNTVFSWPLSGTKDIKLSSASTSKRNKGSSNK